MGFIGLWISKVSLEFTIVTGYILIIKMSDWDEIAEIAVKRLEIANKISQSIKNKVSIELIGNDKS